MTGWVSNPSNPIINNSNMELINPNAWDNFKINDWETVEGDLPGDAIFSPADCQDWDVIWAPGGCIGSGAASILKTEGFHYMLIEAPDITFKEGHLNWVVGLLRSPTLKPSGQWTQYDVNSTVEREPTNQDVYPIQYMRLFTDQGRTYMAYWEKSCSFLTRLKIFEIVPWCDLESKTDTSK